MEMFATPLDDRLANGTTREEVALSDDQDIQKGLPGLFDQCLCHSRQAAAHCPFNERRLSVALSDADEGFSLVWTAVQQLKRGETSIHLSLELPIADIESTLQGSIKCNACKDVALRALRRLDHRATVQDSDESAQSHSKESAIVVEVHESGDKPDKKVLQWTLSSDPTKPGIVIARPQIPSSKRKPDETLPPFVIESRLYEYLRGNDQPRLTPETVASQIQSLQNQFSMFSASPSLEDPETFFYLLKTVDDLVEKVSEGLMYMALYVHNMYEPVFESLNRLVLLAEMEHDGFKEALNLSSSGHFVEAMKRLMRNALDLLGELRNSPASLNALSFAGPLFSGKRSYLFPFRVQGSLYYQAQLLEWYRQHRMFGAELEVSSMHMPLDIVKQSLGWLNEPQHSAHPLRFILERGRELLSLFIGELPAKSSTANDVKRVLQMKPRGEPKWYTGSKPNMALLSEAPLHILDEAAQVFWTGVAGGRWEKKLETVMKLSSTVVPSPQDDDEQVRRHLIHLGLVTISMKQFLWSLGPLDWLLSKVRKDFKCVLFRPDLSGVCFDHVVGRKVMERSAELIRSVRAKEAEEETWRKSLASSAENELMALLSKDDAARKAKQKKKKASATSHPGEVPAPSPVKPVAEPQPDNRVEKDKGPVLPNHVLIASATEVDDSGNNENWESVINKKKGGASKQQQSHEPSTAPESTKHGPSSMPPLHREVWQGRLMCEVVVPDWCFGFVMGEKGKTISQIQKESGCNIKALPAESAKKEVRVFRLEARSEEIVKKASMLIKERVEANAGGSKGSEVEKRFRVFPSAVQHILGNNGRNVFELERLTRCRIAIINSDPKERVVIITGPEAGVAKAYEKLAEYADAFEKAHALAKSATEATFPSNVPSVDSRPVQPPSGQQQTTVAPPIVKAWATPTPAISEAPQPQPQQDDEEEQLKQAMRLSMQEAEARHQKDLELIQQQVAATTLSGQVVEKNERISSLDERQAREAEEARRKQEQEEEDEKLARQLAAQAESEENRPSLPSSSPTPPSTSPPVSTPIVPPPARPAATPVTPTAPAPVPAPAVSLPMFEEVSHSLISTRWEGSKLVVDLPQTYFGKVMGVQGATLSKIENRTKTKIDYLREDVKPKVRRFVISGPSKGVVTDALKMMRDTCGEERSFMLPASVHSKMFADNAKHIRVFEDATNCRMTFQNKEARSDKRIVTLTGPLDGIRKCKYLLEQIGSGVSHAEALSNLKKLPANRPPPSFSSTGSSLTPAAQALLAQRHQQQQQQQQTRRSRGVKGMSGLSNMRGENSCFLNVVVQSLFHFTTFSEEMVRTLANHPRCKAQENPPGRCIVCALVSTFRALGSSEEGTSVSSVELREAVAEAFEGSFDLGKMEDAAEAFEHVLAAVHECIVEVGTEDTDTEGNNTVDAKVCTCLVHRSFASYVFEGVPCKSCVPVFLRNSYQSNEKMREFARGWNNLENVHNHSLIQVHPKYACMVRYIFAAEIAHLSATDYSLKFEQKVRRSMEVSPMSCKCCDAPSLPVERVLTRVPEVVFALGVTWTAEVADPELEVRPFLESISPEFDLATLMPIRTVDGPRDTKLASYPAILRGLICFHRKHYVAFFRKKSSYDWFEFDDATVKAIGPGWPNALNAIHVRKFQPVVLFYEVTNPLVG